MKAIGGLIGKIYDDEIIINGNSDSDTIMVNLLFLLEALVAVRCGQANSSEQIREELLAATDQKLTIPIAVQEMPIFVQKQSKSQNLSAPSKILTHLALYDLTLKLIAKNEPLT